MTNERFDELVESARAMREMWDRIARDALRALVEADDDAAWCARMSRARAIQEGEERDG